MGLLVSSNFMYLGAIDTLSADGIVRVRGHLSDLYGCCLLVAY